MKLACLDLPALPLQLVWRNEPELRAQAVVVIDEDRPQGNVLWACERARAAGVLPGQRYAHALGLHRGLRARVVQPEAIETAITELRAALHELSPRVEPNDEPGTFWLDGEGLERIFIDPTNERAPAAVWAIAIQRTIAERKLRGAVVVGFSRFATYAIARAAKTGVIVLRSDVEERAAASAVPLARLEVDPKLRDALARLGVTTVGQMVRLPGGGILERFGREAHRLYQLAAGERWDPLVPMAPPEAPDEHVVLDDDLDDVESLAFVLKAAIDRLLDRLAARGRALVALHVELTLRHAVGDTTLRADCIKPATATLDSRSLARLVHLRLTGMPPSAPVNAARVWAEDVAATREQLAMFTSRPRRDLRAANEAIARLRAELGDDAVVRAVLREGHLPEASFGWERLQEVVPASPQPRMIRPLVRRLHARPQMLPPQARQVRDDGWLLSGLEHGAVVRIVGPYIISGGWWGAGGELHREYHFAELRRGDCLWVYYDRNRRRWFCQGAVE
ncbi:MAG: Nucleotidyltransferase/DNA polymerase involved in repair-like protein [Myxococcales bacterium]|nr:Nucleotidyltransferase/DNA polymerase involved in repair-like protein [Myxococcales bacterium]